MPNMASDRVYQLPHCYHQQSMTGLSSCRIAAKSTPSSWTSKRPLIECLTNDSTPQLQYYGIAGDTLALLSDRKQSVVVDGSQSSWQDVSSGVPQGSVIGPTLFFIFINDIQDNSKSPLRLFADDCVVYREIVTDDDYHILQQDLLQLSSWSATWQMKFNVKKCAVLSITRTRSPCIYTERQKKLITSSECHSLKSKAST